MEVVVGFEGGDPDKPIVLGSLYNGTHPPPFKLPEHKTMSGIRTSSYPGGRGFNEIAFNDAAGHEKVLIHAQRDMNEMIEHDHSTEVGANETLMVRGNQFETVGHDQHLTIRGERLVAVHHDLKSSVGQNREAIVKGDDGLTVGGDAKSSVSRHFGLDVKGSYTVTVGTGEDGGQSDHYVNGSASLGAADRLVLCSEKEVVIKCGNTEIRLTPEALDLVAKAISGKGAGISLAGDGPSLEMGDAVQLFSKSITMYAEKSTVELGESASVKSDKIEFKKKQPSTSKSSSDGAKDTQPFKCQFSDSNLRPYANKTFHLRTEGMKTEGTTDGEGFVTTDVPKGAKQIVVTIWIDEYPTGRRRTFSMNHVDMPDSSAPKGAQMRLLHLGYFTGDPGEELTEAARSALMWFQTDHQESHGLEITGELDGPTAGALEDVYGS